MANRAKKIKTAKAVREVKLNLKNMVGMGWISQAEYKSKLQQIGLRMRRGE